MCTPTFTISCSKVDDERGQAHACILVKDLSSTTHSQTVSRLPIPYDCCAAFLHPWNLAVSVLRVLFSANPEFGLQWLTARVPLCQAKHLQRQSESSGSPLFGGHLVMSQRCVCVGPNGALFRPPGARHALPEGGGSNKHTTRTEIYSVLGNLDVRQRRNKNNGKIPGGPWEGPGACKAPEVKKVLRNPCKQKWQESKGARRDCPGAKYVRQVMGAIEFGSKVVRHRPTLGRCEANCGPIL